MITTPIDRICAIVTAAALLITVLFMNGQALGITAVADEDAEGYSGTEYFTANDLDGAWDTAGAVKISLGDENTSIAGAGAYFYDGDLVIKNGGWYTVTGELTDGSIIVDAYTSSKIWILLNGVQISCGDDSALIVKKADKVFLTLAEDSENVFSDADSYSEDAQEEGRNAAVYSKEDLTVNGTGMLVVHGNYQHGIKCNDSLVITGGTLDVTSQKDGIHANDSIHITSADITINAGDDAVHCDTEIYYQDGSLLAEECYEGLEAPQIEIAGGDITIYASDDGINANGGSGDAFGMGGMRGMRQAGGMPQMGGIPQAGETDQTDGAAQAGSPPQMGDTPGGEAFQGADSGERASGTSTEEMPEPGFREGMHQEAAESDSEEETSIVHITGGNITIINENGHDADGIDSNGDIIIDGGTVLVSLGGTGNNALDFGSESGGQLFINGGTVIAAGSASMLESVSDDSEQCSATIVLEEQAETGTIVRAENADGTVILEQELPTSFDAVTVSTPEFVSGGSFTIMIGEESQNVTFDQTVMSAGAQAGRMESGGMGRMGAFGNFQQDSEEGAGSQESPWRQTKESDGETDSAAFRGDPAQDMDGETDSAAFRGNPMQGADGEIPAMPESGGMEPPGIEKMAGTESEETVPGETIDKDTWREIGISSAVLFAGIIFAYFYRRRGKVTI